MKSVVSVTVENTLGTTNVVDAFASKISFFVYFKQIKKELEPDDWYLTLVRC